MDTKELPFPFHLRTEDTSSSHAPRKIDNSEIILTEQGQDFIEDEAHPYFNYRLKPGLSEGPDYVLIPHKAFEILRNIYGINQDIVRYAIEQNDTIYQIEVFLTIIRVAYVQDSTLVVQHLSTSRKNNISYIKKLVLKKLNLHSQSRAWKVDTSKVPLERLRLIALRTFSVYLDASIVEEETMIDDAEIAEGSILLIEVARNSKYLYSDNPDSAQGKCGFCQMSSRKQACKLCGEKMYCSATCLKAHSAEHKPMCRPKKKKFFSLFSCFCRQPLNVSDTEEDLGSTPVVKSKKHQSGSIGGVFKGLQNLGNTCFMNSALQCLSHTETLTRFFMSGDFLRKINKNNPLGSNGRLASAYAELLHSMQNSSESSVAPWKLKKTVAQFAPQFLGHQQHDSHELLLFLINGLHEDLNQVSKKPYFDSDIKETTDREMASESWKRHVARNQSVIADLMYGQYKSTLHCPRCQRYSYAFDPFNCLSLPIPQNVQKKIQVVYVPYASAEAVIYFTFVLEATAKISDIAGRVAGYFKKERMGVVAMQSRDSAMAVVSLETSIESIRSVNLFLYEFPGEYTEFVVLNLCRENNYTNNECYPRILGMNREGTLTEFHRRIFEFLRPFFARVSSQETFATMLEQQAYRVSYDSNRNNICVFCANKVCMGCVIKPDLTKIGGIMKEKNYFSVNVSVPKNTAKKVADFTPLKRSEQARLPPEPANTKTITIYDCFNSFSLPEILDKNNLWYCSTCKMHVQASKKLEIYKGPPILVIHMKRFKTNGLYREKLGVPIKFPSRELDISQHIIGETPPIYDLYAVSNHFGALAGGHYTASIFAEATGKWYNCNDSEITEAKELSEVAAYVLFYKARTLT